MVASHLEAMSDPMLIEDVGNVLTTTVENLEDADEHYFCVKAYDASSNESTCSNVVHSPALPETVLPELDFEVEVELLP